MSITTCLKHAIDGYSFWGANIIAKVGESWEVDKFTDTFASMVLTETYASDDASQLQSQIGTNGAGAAGLNLA